MNILYITNGISGSGGLERVLSLKTDYLISHNAYKISIITLNDSIHERFFKFNQNINFIDLEFKNTHFNKFFNYVNGLKNNINRLKPDIIVVCDDGLKGFFIPFFIRNNIPIIYERHVSKFIELSNSKSVYRKIRANLKWKIMDIMGQYFDKFILLTQGNKKEWAMLNNIEIISNPLPFTCDSNNFLEHKKVIAVGKHCFQKGFDLLIESWAKVNDKHPDWTLEIYGKKDDKLKLLEQINSLNLNSSVKILDPVSNIEEVYKATSIFVLSSRFEGFGMVLIEAMSFGVPCISFDCPHGPADIISHNINGLLVENGNVRELANSISVLISDVEKRKYLGGQAKIDVNKYKIDVIMTKWDTLFKSLSK
jgi:glycosyltransferase involved in cell wall biosynthesis